MIEDEPDLDVAGLEAELGKLYKEKAAAQKAHERHVTNNLLVVAHGTWLDIQEIEEQISQIAASIRFRESKAKEKAKETAERAAVAQRFKDNPVFGSF